MSIIWRCGHEPQLLIDYRGPDNVIGTMPSPDQDITVDNHQPRPIKQLDSTSHITRLLTIQPAQGHHGYPTTLHRPNLRIHKFTKSNRLIHLHIPHTRHIPPNIQRTTGQPPCYNILPILPDRPRHNRIPISTRRAHNNERNSQILQ